MSDISISQETHTLETISHTETENSNMSTTKTLSYPFFNCCGNSVCSVDDENRSDIQLSHSLSFYAQTVLGDIDK